MLNENLLPWRWRHNVTSNIAIYIHVSERVAVEASSKANILGMNANTVIIFPGYTWIRRSYGIRFSRWQVKGQGHRVTRWPWHLNARQLLKYQDEKKLVCRAHLWVCCYGNQDSVLPSVVNIARDRIWRPFWMVVKLKYSLDLVEESQSA